MCARARGAQVGEAADALGDFLFRAGRVEEAERHLSRALELCEASSEGGETKSVECAKLVNNLGAALKKLGKLEQARPLHERAARLSAELFGPAHRNAATARANLVELLEDLGEGPAAVDVLAAAVAEIEAAPAEQADAAAKANALGATLRDLGLTQQKVGRMPEAEASLRRAHSVLHAQFGDANPATATALASVAAFLRAAGRPEEALPPYEQLRAVTEAALGKTHPQTAMAEHTLACVLLELGRPADALPHSERACAAVRSTHGPTHPSLAQFLKGLEDVARAAGDEAKAAAAAEENTQVEAWLARKRSEFEMNKTLRQATKQYANGLGASAKQRLEQKQGGQPLLHETQERLREKLAKRSKSKQGARRG